MARHKAAADRYVCIPPRCGFRPCRRSRWVVPAQLNAQLAGFAEQKNISGFDGSCACDPMPIDERAVLRVAICNLRRFIKAGDQGVATRQAGISEDQIIARVSAYRIRMGGHESLLLCPLFISKNQAKFHRHAQHGLVRFVYFFRRDFDFGVRRKLPLHLKAKVCRVLANDRGGKKARNVIDVFVLKPVI